MKVLVSWLRELVDVPVGIEALAERLHLAGFELASITPVPPVPGPDGSTAGPDAGALGAGAADLSIDGGDGA